MRSDWENLQRARDGEEDGWRLLFEKHYAPLVRMTALITGSLDAGKDIVQETFFRLLRVKETRNAGNFKAYLSTIAFRLALKEKSRLRRAELTAGADFPSDASSPLESIVREEDQKQIVRVIQLLTDQYREIIVLRFYGEQGYEEIAETLGIPIGTVKSRIFNAVRECRKLMKKRGIL